jgi:hypothetical protein
LVEYIDIRFKNSLIIKLEKWYFWNKEH